MTQQDASDELAEGRCSAPSQGTQDPSVAIAVPDLSPIDAAFGNIGHLPKWDEIPDDFKQMRGNAYTTFVSEWFFSGRTEADMARLAAREGIDRAKALRAVAAILRSFSPKHEHKEAGAGYLLSQWFELAPKTEG